MIVGINYNTDGTRYIAGLIYSIFYKTETIQEMAKNYIEDFDEVYIIDFNPNFKPLIQDIVLNGCRIS